MKSQIISIQSSWIPPCERSHRSSGFYLVAFMDLPLPYSMKCMRKKCRKSLTSICTRMYRFLKIFVISGKRHQMVIVWNSLQKIWSKSQTKVICLVKLSGWKCRENPTLLWTFSCHRNTRFVKQGTMFPEPGKRLKF